MKAEILNGYAKRIEEAGLKRDAKVIDNHHYVIAVEVTPKNYNEVIEGMPDAFECCYDRYDKDTGKEESICMFYLEDCNETDASEIERWLKANKNWRTFG